MQAVKVQTTRHADGADRALVERGCALLAVGAPTDVELAEGLDCAVKIAQYRPALARSLTRWAEESDDSGQLTGHIAQLRAVVPAGPKPRIHEESEATDADAWRALRKVSRELWAARRRCCGDSARAYRRRQPHRRAPRARRVSRSHAHAGDSGDSDGSDGEPVCDRRLRDIARPRGAR